MKTTIEIPDFVFRRAKAFSASRGMALKQFITEAVEEKLRACSGRKSPAEPPWMQLAGSLKKHAPELRRAERVIEQECEQVNPEDWK